jgi:subtilisin family serine protease
MKRFLASSLILVVCALAPLSVSLAQTQKNISFTAFAQSTAKFHRGERTIPGQYIVTFNDDMDRKNLASTAESLATRHRGSIIYIYKHAIRGFAVRMSEQQAIALSNNPLLASVAEVGYSVITAVQSTPQGPTTFWGLDRLDSRALSLDNLYQYNRLGTDIHAYVLDTGIWVTHDDFGGRARTVDGSNGGFDAFGGDGIDRNNHGTFVAGVIGGKSYGVAKNVQLHSVKVCNDSGFCPDTAVVAGIDWVMSHRINPAVMNMSFGGFASQSPTFVTVDNAVRSAISAGITCVIGAGNNNVNVSSFYPAHVSEAITVGATKRTDSRASYSNFGAGLDLFAPGGESPSDFIPVPASGFNYGGANNIIDGATGTSIAAPHVTGMVAQYLQVNRAASPADVAFAITSNATVGAVINPGSGSPNLLLYTRFLAPGDNRADFDGDFKTDVSVFNRSTGLWSRLNSSDGQAVHSSFGLSGDIAVAGDYDGDGKTDVAIFRPGDGNWWISKSSNGAVQVEHFGQNGDIPVARDYDADGRTDIAIFRPSTGYWWITYSTSGASAAIPFGQNGDHVVPGDYDGDDKADIAIVRAGQWWITRSRTNTVVVENFGLGSDWPVQADYDGDGLTDIAIFRPSDGQWWIAYSSNGSVPVVGWGAFGDRPAPGDYDADSKADIVVQRPDATGAFWILSSRGGSSVINFSSEFPVAAAYLTPLF